MISELLYSHSFNMKRSSSVYTSLLLAARNVSGVFEKRAPGVVQDPIFEACADHSFCTHNDSQPIRFVRLDSEHAQSDEKSVNQRFLVTFPEVTILVADQKERCLW